MKKKTNHWPTKKLGEISSVGAGNSAPQKKEFFNNGTYPFFRTSDVGQVRISKSLVDASDHLNEEGIRGMKLYPKGTLLLPKSGASTFLNHRVIMGVDGYVSSHLATITVNKKLADECFLFYFLQLIKAQELIQDHKYPSLNLPVISNISVPLPPLPEQKRLVSLLDQLFGKIDQAKTIAQKNLENAKKLFEVYSDSVFGDPKKGWEKLKLGDLIHEVEYGSSAKSKKEGDVPVLRMGNIQNGRFDWSNLKYTSDKDEIKKYSLKYNDVLFNRTNSPELVGKTAIYKGEMPAIFAGYLIRIQRKENLLDADFLNYYLASNQAIDYGKSVMISSVNQANINGKKLKEYPIFTPTLKEQKTLVTQLDQLSAHTQQLQTLYRRKLEVLEELKKSILQKAFSGEL